MRRASASTRRRSSGRPDGWRPALADAALGDGQRRAVDVEGDQVLLVRDGGRVRLAAGRCCHRGGPLDRGEVADGCVTCPWHGSTFRLEDGSSCAALPPTRSRPTTSACSTAASRCAPASGARRFRPAAEREARGSRSCAAGAAIACPVGGGRRRRATPMAAMKTKNAKKPIVGDAFDDARRRAQGPSQPAKNAATNPVSRSTSGAPMSGDGDQVQRHDDAQLSTFPV